MKKKHSHLLTIEEQTLIYKYTEDGYETLNEKLRISKGKELSQFGKFLDKTIAKLPNYEGIAYRSAKLIDSELKKYIEAKENIGILVEHLFLQVSRNG
ncbi:ADP-ribosyltransferase [Mucilaginibacter sp.]|uniref:ADP-ribosyltransferase n=1 Tax=Mucilaginibacter sp. TaxID=1882438 RepID=UPI00283DD481|nr:ADP-ribosyltransferase [Mucilaginibacter sp.]MDR3697876.1 ADP-ribosyltransferase [Mucilaginibacter sp.]